MAGGYFIDSSTHVVDETVTTEPQELSIDSNCGAAVMATMSASMSASAKNSTTNIPGEQP